TASRPGLLVLEDLSPITATRIASSLSAVARAGDVVVVSIHWGPNWGYPIETAHRRFAHALIDSGVIDVVYGHSSHHARGIEVYRDRPILYGCGDLLNDYEGIRGHEEYRDDLALLYFVELDTATRRL